MKRFKGFFGAKTADFSPCREFRYTLWRRWSTTNKKYVAFVCLNPSTADETNDDPTIRRCIRFARSWGAGGVCILNLFALRATDPNVMKAHDEPVGPENDVWIERVLYDADIVIAGWGVHGTHLERAREIMTIFDDIDFKCLGKTKDGHPRHPLYVRADVDLLEYAQEDLK